MLSFVVDKSARVKPFQLVYTVVVSALFSPPQAIVYGTPIQVTDVPDIRSVA